MASFFQQFCKEKRTLIHLWSQLLRLQSLGCHHNFASTLCSRRNVFCPHNLKLLGFAQLDSRGRLSPRDPYRTSLMGGEFACSDTELRENEPRPEALMKTKTILRVAGACMAALIFLAGAAMAQQGSESVERQIFDAANQARRAQGLGRLKWDAALARAAQQHAAVMARKNSLSHQFPGEPGLEVRASHAGVYFISLSENVAQGPNAANISDQWAESPQHRQNLLDPDMNVIGVGVAERNGELFAVEDFAKIKPTAPLP
jgi:uncharacterized protein YkwD